MELKELKNILFFLKKNKLCNIPLFSNTLINEIKYILTKQITNNTFSLTKEQEDYLINFFINNNLIITNQIPKFIIENKKCIISSIKIDPSSFDIIKKENLELCESILFNLDDSLNLEIFKTLLLKHYKFSDKYLLKMSLSIIKEPEILNYYLNYFDLYKTTNQNLKIRFLKIIQDILLNPPKIKDFYQIFDYLAEERWKILKNKHINLYNNVFGKICNHLRILETNFEESLLKFDILFKEELKNILKDKYQILLDNMEQYYNIYHSDTENKLIKLKKNQDVISKLSSLYVSISKEKTKKNELKKYNELLEQYYELNIKSPFVKKKIYEKKQKEKLEQLYLNNDDKLLSYINNIIKKYKDLIPKQTIKKMIEEFIVLNYEIVDIFKMPSGFNDYLFYLKALKIINRLNNNYISFNDLEVFIYKDFITYDNKQKKYIYIKDKFSNSEIKRFNDYKILIDVFKKIKRDIMIYAKNLEISLDLTDDDTKELKKEIPFDDLNYNFKKENLDFFNFNDLYDAFFIKLIDFDLEKFYLNIEENTVYEYICNLFINNNFIWFLLILFSPNMNFLSYQKINEILRLNDVFKMGKNLNLVIKEKEKYKLSINDLKDFLNMSLVCNYLTPLNMAILGFDMIYTLANDLAYTDYNTNKIIESACDLLSLMSFVNKKTVPYISGTHLNYKYSMYDIDDDSILLSGINTASCFKICGNDNDFLYYCALNKNGFIIKIEDCYDNFIAKAAGFRNGNCVYINQLRTIYDSDKSLTSYSKEKEDIINTFKKSCEEIIRISNQNPNEDIKIEFVFVNQSYILNDYKENVSNEVVNFIGYNPMDTTSDNWKEFLSLTDQLDEAYYNYFNTDYGEYPIICMASSKKNQDIFIKDIKPSDVLAVYKRDKKEIIITSSNLNVLNKVNKIKAINAYLKKEDFKEITDLNTIVILGFNWYIILKDNKIIDTCVIGSDFISIDEYYKILVYLKDNILDENTINKLKILIK